MTISTAQIEAVLDWFYNERAIDIQGLSNQDNPALIGKKYVIQSIAFAGAQTAVELLAADIDNFSVNQVIKFTDIADGTLEGELSDLVPEQLRIDSIDGAFLMLNLDGTGFTGTFTAGDRLVNTYNIRVINQAIKQGIIEFERSTGISFDETSEHHIDFACTAAIMRLSGRASASYRNMKEDLDNSIKQFQAAKGGFFSSDSMSIDEADYDMNNRETRHDFGIDFPDNQQFD